MGEGGACLEKYHKVKLQADMHTLLYCRKYDDNRKKKWRYAINLQAAGLLSHCPQTDQKRSERACITVVLLTCYAQTVFLERMRSPRVKFDIKHGHRLPGAGEL